MMDVGREGRQTCFSNFFSFLFSAPGYQDVKTRMLKEKKSKMDLSKQGSMNRT